MPDPLRQTVSASQIAALWNESPYITRWMLFQNFANGMELEVVADERMTEGRRMQPLILERTARELKLVVTENNADVYVRNGLIGCTRDAEIICPDRGPGALEVKCCFDYRTWMREWGGGEFVPRHVEIQLQAQMLVGAGARPAHERGAAFHWGVIVVWVGAHQYYFERSPNLPLWERMRTDAATFMDDVINWREPDPFGSPSELPWLAEMYPTKQSKVLDLREDERGEQLARNAVVYIVAKRDENAGKKLAEGLRASFLAVAKDAETVLLPGGAYYYIGKRQRLKVTVPNMENDDE